MKKVCLQRKHWVHRYNYVFIICRPITMREWKFRSHQDHKLNIFFVSLKDPTFNNRKQPLYNIRLFLAWFCADVYNILRLATFPVIDTYTKPSLLPPKRIWFPARYRNTVKNISWEWIIFFWDSYFLKWKSWKWFRWLLESTTNVSFNDKT